MARAKDAGHPALHRPRYEAGCSFEKLVSSRWQADCDLEASAQRPTYLLPSASTVETRDCQKGVCLHQT